LQVQKTKVDTENAALALDKIMRANELNFQVLSTLPLLWTLSVLGSALLSRLGRRRLGHSFAAKSTLRDQLLTVIRTVNQRFLF
jgi:hypothetical protein